MGAVLFSLLTCLAWGGAEFLGGLKSRTIPVLLMLIIVELTGIIIIVPTLLLYGDRMLEPDISGMLLRPDVLALSGGGAFFVGWQSDR
ncbi:MAG: hypothetical protein HQ557_10450 [Bacteroidetes bacterium]|nr:hypothetical protein [Bacteroidota bacterium]